MASLEINQPIKFTLEKYSNFHKVAKETISQILLLKNQEYDNEIENLLKLEEKYLVSEFLLFMNYEKWIYINIDDSNKDNIYIIEILNHYKIYRDKNIFNSKFFKIIFHMYLYLVIKIEDLIKSISQMNEEESEKENLIKDLNESIHILIQIFIMIAKLYIENICDFKKLLLLLDILIFFIKKKNEINDKYFKIKNMILQKLLFDFFGKISSIILKENRSKSDILYFFNYLTKYLNNEEVKSLFTKLILINKNILPKFISTVLNNFNYLKMIHEDIYKLCKTGIMDSFETIFNQNANKSNFFEILINQNKKSFVNLHNFKNKKDLIIKDIYIQNFYIELLNKLFESEKNGIKNNKHFIPLKNSFIFNGYNSKMSFKLNKFFLENSIIFFSFRLNENTNKEMKILPLISFENELKEILFKLFIMKVTKENSKKESSQLFIFQEKNKNKIINLFNLDDDISPNVNYFIAIYFMKKKVCINLKKVSLEEEQNFHQEIEISLFKESQMIIKIGYSNDKNENFKGYMGPFVIINNLVLKKGVSYEDMIDKVLDLKDNYYHFPYYTSVSTTYNLKDMNLFYQIEDVNSSNAMKKYFQDNIVQSECTLYLTPQLINICNTLIGNSSSFVFMPMVPDICESQKYYVVLEMNISMTNFDNIYETFLSINGFDYLCLIYEYFYQFSNLYLQNKDNFDLGQKEQNLKRIIINTIIKTILILKNYCKIKYINKVKNTYNNLYLCLKSMNKIWNILNQELISNLSEIVFTFKERAIDLKEKFKANKIDMNNPRYIDFNNNVMPFTDDLINILFDVEFYEKKEEENPVEILFFLVSVFILNYINKMSVHKEFPFKSIFWKIINFTQILENLFTNDYKNKNKIVFSFFDILEKYFIAIKDFKKDSDYFKILLKFAIGNYQKDLKITYNFLEFIHEMMWKGYTFDEEAILLLLKYSNQFNIEKEDKDKVTQDLKIRICSLISCILVDLIFNKDSKNASIIIDHVYKKLNEFSNNNKILCSTINEVKNIIEGLFQINTSKSYENGDSGKHLKYKENITNYMNFYWNIFNFIIMLFKNSIGENENISKEIKDNDSKRIKMKNSINFFNIFSLLTDIEEILRNKITKKETNIHCIYCLINFVKFYHYIIFHEKYIITFLEKGFIDNLLQVINLCSKINLINSNQLFKVSINDSENSKTIIEIVLEIYFQLFFNDCYIKETYKSLISSIYIFYDKKFEKDKNYTKFYINDYYRYILTKKKLTDKESKLKNNILSINNNISSVEGGQFDNNFTTTSLLIIAGYQKSFKNRTVFHNIDMSDIKKIIEQLYSSILEEHQYLIELNKDYFLKNCPSNNQYNELIKILKNKFIKKRKNSEEEIKLFFESNEFNLNPEKKEKEKNIDKKENDNSSNNNISDPSLSSPISINQNNIITDDSVKNEEKEKNIRIESVEFPENLNSIKYFKNLNKTFLKNPKKQIMNNIFSLYYIDVFYYNKTFCRMKNYFINYFLNYSEPTTKLLDYPSKIKNYSNNLEPPLFVKQYNDFFNDPIFAITHSYINKNNHKIIEDYETIKLLKKPIPITKSMEKYSFECELIKTDYYYFGKLIIGPTGYLLFNEEEIDINDEKNEIKYLLLLSYYTIKEKENQFSKSKLKREKYKEQRQKKIVLVVFKEIEEIVERRTLLMWKSVEIFLKNGKSYLFNFLNISEYENFMKIFRNDDLLNGLIKRKDFFSSGNIFNEWKKGLINNYEYILLVNKYSSRSFNDVNEYPVFPWLLLKYTDMQEYNDKERLYEEELKKQMKEKREFDELYKNNKNIKNNKNKNPEYERIKTEIKDRLRNFKYPPTLQTREKRDRAKEKFIDGESSDEFCSHCGCHYATSAYIYFYLMRQQPYTNLIVKLQGYELENTNRVFISISTTEKIIDNGSDNRELIPEFFSKIEHFLNLNCSHYGYLEKSKRIVDDAVIDNFKNQGISEINSKYPLSKCTHFILGHRQLINSKVIGFYINKWIDNVFGVNQLPKDPNQRKNCCNIFSQYSYEQEMNLSDEYNKLNSNIDNASKKKIKGNLELDFNFMLNFGETPHQIFNEPHVELDLKINQKNESNNNSKDINELDNEEEDYDFESIISSSLRIQNLTYAIKKKPLYFQINSSMNKILIYNAKGEIITYDCQLFNRKQSEHFNILPNASFNIEDPKIFSYEQIDLKYEFFLCKLKYAFSSFEEDKIADNNSKENNYFQTYYTEFLNNNQNKANVVKKIKDKINKKKIENNENEILKIITCRHIDLSFKIHYFKKKNKKESIHKVFSFICEDFVSSVCTLSSDEFILGLKNGKLISCSLELTKKKVDEKNKNDEFININISIDKYIQGHHGKINVIEIDQRIGVVITAGDDNYIFLRKIYDFELLLPIKIKQKYKILMAKISYYNFLYILCFNTKRNQTTIFGYTLSGLKFAKSEYGLYDNISFTKNGNVVTIDNRENVVFFSGSDLSRLKINQDEETISVLSKIKGSLWMEFDCFMRKFDDNISKIATFVIPSEKKEYKIQTLNVENVQNFD